MKVKDINIAQFGGKSVKILKRIMLSLGALFLILSLLLVISFMIDYAIGRDRMASVSNTTIPGFNGGPPLAAYVARPDGNGPFPAVIMIHEFYGLNESIIDKAEGLSESGYVVLAPDTFRGSTTAWIPRAIFQVLTTSSEQVNKDLDSTFAWAAAQPDIDPERIAVLGFCYGGRASLSYSLHNPEIAATVIFYGSPETDPQVLRNLPGPVLGIFGEADSSIPLSQVYAFEAGLDKVGIPNEIAIYEGQPHAFLTSMQAIRAGGAQAEAWAQMLSFLEIHLKPANSSEKVGGGIAYHPSFPWGYYARLVYEHTFGGASHTH
jgi:carboxymethylenebutenolidase